MYLAQMKIHCMLTVCNEMLDYSVCNTFPTNQSLFKIEYLCLFCLVVHLFSRRRLLLGLKFSELSVILFIVDPNVFIAWSLGLSIGLLILHGWWFLHVFHYNDVHTQSRGTVNPVPYYGTMYLSYHGSMSWHSTKRMSYHNKFSNFS